MVEFRLMTIAICSSASFYKEVLTIKRKLERIGFRVKIPPTAYEMKKTGDFNVEHYKTWFKDKKNYKIKARLMRDHFKKIVESDAILVVNNVKNGMPGYIGGNGLMEMAIAFYLEKPIYILNNISDNSPFKEEILGMEPLFIDKDLKRIILKEQT